VKGRIVARTEQANSRATLDPWKHIFHSKLGRGSAIQGGLVVSNVQFEIRKINNVGVGHPVVARLGVQASDLIAWMDIEDAKRKEIASLYAITLTQRLLRCYQLRNDLAKLVNAAVEAVPPPQGDKRIREVPHVVGLQGVAEGFLYEAKNYLRDLLNLFRIAYDCKLTDASAFANLKGEGDSEIVTWAASTFEPNDELTKLLRTEQEWVAEPIRMRNAVEHPGGFSGTLTLTNIRADPNQFGSYIAPTWARTGRPDSDIVKDMDCGLDNMLTLAEDLLVGVVIKKTKSANLIKVVEIPSEERDLQCPIRLRVEPSEEILSQLPRRQPAALTQAQPVRLIGKQGLRQQDRAWREKKKRQS
jgi:hypothetical protein